MALNKILLDHIEQFGKLRSFSGTFKMIWSVVPNPGICPLIGVLIPF